MQIPRPLGNQPRRPPDDPLAELVVTDGDRYACPFKLAPPCSCYLGARGGCAWGVQSEEDRYCCWVFIRRHPNGAYEKELSEALGMSRERIRQWLHRAITALAEKLRNGVGEEDQEIAAALAELEEMYHAA